jgi:hypothetical protein
MSLEIMALLDLPKEGQEALFECKKLNIIRALASNSSNMAIMDRLALSNDYATKLKALRFTENQDIIIDNLGVESNKSFTFYRNPKIAPTELVKALSAVNHQTNLAGFTNPSTPEFERKSALTPALAESMVEIGGNVGDRVVRAYALVDANSFILERAGDWSATIRRAIAGLPGLTEEQSNLIRKAGWSGWVSHNKHPLKKKIKMESIPTSDLVKIGSSATDLEAIMRKDFSFAYAREIVSRRVDDAEPNVIAKIVSIYGIKVLAEIGYIAGTRIKSSAWLDPKIAYCQKLDYEMITSLELARDILGNSKDNW